MGSKRGKDFSDCLPEIPNGKKNLPIQNFPMVGEKIFLDRKTNFLARRKIFLAVGKKK